MFKYFARYQILLAVDNKQARYDIFQVELPIIEDNYGLQGKKQNGFRRLRASS